MNIPLMRSFLAKILKFFSGRKNDAMTTESSIIFGTPQEWDLFKKRHSLYFERFPNLQTAIKVAFLRQQESDPTDQVVFFFGRLCVEEFNEILLLCGNGRGVGAMKILRGMFERIVTARYLHRHPEETAAFMDFSWITEYKLQRNFVDLYGKDHFEGHPEREELFKHITEMRNQVKSQFVRECEKCGHKTLNFSWTKKDMVSMAIEVGLGSFVLPAYSLPTQFGHSTMHSLKNRLRKTQGGEIGFDESPTRRNADTCLVTAHGLLLNALALQQERFKIVDLEQSLQQCLSDQKEIWPGKQSNLATVT